MANRKRRQSMVEVLDKATVRGTGEGKPLGKMRRPIVTRKQMVQLLEWDRHKLFENLLESFGIDTDREGLKDTPKRWVKAMQFLTSGYKQNPYDVVKSFEDGANGYNEMVLQRDIPLWSLCEHHVLPFFGVAHIAYIPDRRIVGLSKLSRVVDVFARRLQVQERLTVEVADFLSDALHPLGVGVVLECRHTCMECRGVQKANTVTQTSALRGALLEGRARAEFLTLLRSK